MSIVAGAIAKRLGPGGRGWLAGIGAILLLFGVLLRSGEAVPQISTAKAPQTLQETGLYSDFATLQVDPAHLAFSPQYPLWTDGATKRRWISLPPGSAIDASDPDAWVFPVGTRLWKEFSFDGRRVETRYLQLLADGEWLYAAYEWSADGREAWLAPERGKRNAYPLAGGRSHTIPGTADCKVCHQANPSEVLGFSALQLSSDRDRNALHAELQAGSGVDLRYLVENGLVIALPKSLQQTPPRIKARSATERAALGYMHGNCGHCHNAQGPLKNLGLFLRQVQDPSTPSAITTTVEHPVKALAPGQPDTTKLRIEPGRLLDTPRQPHGERAALTKFALQRYIAPQQPA